MADESATTEQTVTLSGRYVVAVAALVVLIIGTLTYLWRRERSYHLEAARAGALLQSENARMKQVLLQMGSLGPKLEAPEPAAAAMRPFQREDHVPVPVTVDGERRQAYRLPASGATRFGFREGDVILVVASPASASAPATTTRSEE